MVIFGCLSNKFEQILAISVETCHGTLAFPFPPSLLVFLRIIDLVKKRAQLKQAVAKMVTECCTFLDKTPDKVLLLLLLLLVRMLPHFLLLFLPADHAQADRHPANSDCWQDLRREREGEVGDTELAFNPAHGLAASVLGSYCSYTCHRLTHRLAMIHEKDGNPQEAAKIMQELQVWPLGLPDILLTAFLQVETYGSMERQEKVELILEQMRLCLLTEDYIRSVA